MSKPAETRNGDINMLSGLAAVVEFQGRIAGLFAESELLQMHHDVVLCILVGSNARMQHLRSTG